MPRRSLAQLYRDEFRDYNAQKFQKDLLAGLTVTAVALPLALAFGVASGATAAAGLVTAILAGFVIGALSGAPYQISGPTGAMSAVLILLVQQYGLEGVWVAGVISGVMLLIIGLLKLGRFIAFIPSAVITGFTSGIALIIFIGQIDNFLGVKTPAEDAALFKLIGYFHQSFSPNWSAVLIGAIVFVIMLFWPSKWASRFPSSLLGIIVATTVSLLFKFHVTEIGTIPQTLFLAERLNPLAFDWSNLSNFIAPALTITALSAIESLLCGSVAGNMTGIRLQANQELVGQGIGNILIPFFGGVPATAAIARTSVGIKSGGQTRLVSIIHAIGLMLSMFLLAPIMARIPLAALAAVLMVTAVKMNEWHAIKFMFSNRFKTDITAFLLTMLATITLDLTQAILIGTFLAGAVFLNKIASISIDVQKVDPERLRARGIDSGTCEHVKVAFLTGPLFFAASGQFMESFADLNDTHIVILSMRGVPLVDTSGIESVRALHAKLVAKNGDLYFAGVHDNVLEMFKRGGLTDLVGEQNFFWSADQAIIHAEHTKCGLCDQAA